MKCIEKKCDSDAVEDGLYCEDHEPSPGNDWTIVDRKIDGGNLGYRIEVPTTNDTGSDSE